MHIGDVEAEPGQREPIGQDLDERQARHLLGLRVLRSFDARDDGQHVRGDARELFQVVAIDPDRHVRSDAGDQLVEPHLDGLDELVAGTRHLLHSRVHLGHELCLGLARIGPLVARLHDDERVGHRGRHGIGGDIGGADLGEHLRDFREALDATFERRLHRHRLTETRAGDAKRVERDVAFIEIGDELRPQAGRGEAADHDQSDRSGDDRHPHSQRPVEQRTVASPGRPHYAVLLFIDAPRDEGRDRRGHEGERQ